ncbi:MAG: hypothetical protein M1838_002326 [Thelocarpon superellum]|nr:MAG: hypothetical protein M1838_002326 [Thelocarpon superellum]
MIHSAGGDIKCRPLDRISNFRDVGRAINHIVGREVLHEGRLFRSARPDEATDDDRHRLVHDYQITAIVDLRTKSEQIEQARKRNERLPRPTQVVAAGSLRVPGVVHHEINLNGGTFERQLFFRLPCWERAKVLVLMLLGYRMEAISVLATQVLLPRGLIGLGRDSVDYCGDQIRQTFRLLADASSYPIMIHCTQGKDRTGLIIALVLFLLDIPVDAISQDYTRSEAELEAEWDERLEEIRGIGLTEAFARTPGDWVEKIHLHIRAKYGDITAYLAGIGVDEQMQDQIQMNLLHVGAKGGKLSERI